MINLRPTYSYLKQMIEHTDTVIEKTKIIFIIIYVLHDQIYIPQCYTRKGKIAKHRKQKSLSPSDVHSKVVK